MNPLREPFLWIGLFLSGLALLFMFSEEEGAYQVAAGLGYIAAATIFVAGIRGGLRAAREGHSDLLDRRAAEVCQAVIPYAAEVAQRASRAGVMGQMSMPEIAAATVSVTGVQAMSEGLREVAPVTRDAAAVTAVADDAAARVVPYISQLETLHRRMIEGLTKQAEGVRGQALEVIRQDAEVYATAVFRQEQADAAMAREQARAETARQEAAAAAAQADAARQQAEAAEAHRRMQEQRAAAESAEAQRLAEERAEAERMEAAERRAAEHDDFARRRDEEHERYARAERPADERWEPEPEPAPEPQPEPETTGRGWEDDPDEDLFDDDAASTDEYAHSSAASASFEDDEDEDW